MQDRGLRFYNPKVGRWVSRDPIGEEGGANIYVMVYNSPFGILDPHGLGAFFPSLPSIMPRPIKQAVEGLEKNITDTLTQLAQLTAMNSCCIARCGALEMIPGVSDVADYLAKWNAEVNGLGQMLNQLVLSYPQSNFNLLKWCKTASVKIASIASKVSTVATIISAAQFVDCVKKCRECPEKYGCESEEIDVN